MALCFNREVEHDFAPAASRRDRSADAGGRILWFGIPIWARCLWAWGPCDERSRYTGDFVAGYSTTGTRSTAPTTEKTAVSGVMPTPPRGGAVAHPAVEDPLNFVVCSWQPGCMSFWNVSLWLALSETVAVVGCFLQARSALIDSIDSMRDFLRSRHLLFSEVRDRELSAIPRWRMLRRWRVSRRLVREVDSTLTSSETALVRRYDRQGAGWSFILVSATVLCVVGWSQLTL